MEKFMIIGIMSGTSLDGVDLAHCTFEETSEGYSFELGACETIPYSESWLKRLKTLPESSSLVYAETHTAYGKYLGELVRDFLRHNQLEADFVASHGHTIFHNPAKKHTAQIGEGAALASGCGLPVVCDFRTGDVAAGGQGAPLVPIGDQVLFSRYDYCLNLGGFANISMQKNESRIAFDIAPANFILNYIANKIGKPYDKNGEMAAAGQIRNEFLAELNKLDYYQLPPPKSLGREWIENKILPLLTKIDISAEDAASTFCEHVAIQIAACVLNDSQKKMLVTGGGAFNTFLLKRIEAYTSVKLIIPDQKTINYKEALVFAFLGLLRMQQKPNCLSSVTGATHDVSGGAVYLP